MVDFHYQVIRRPRRRTASISVTPDNSVTVVVPESLSENQIVQLVNRKKGWIKGKILFNDHVRKYHKPKQYISGESFSYLGKNYRLKIIQGKPDGVKLTKGRFTVQVPENITKEEREYLILTQLSNWYREHALERLRIKSERFSEVIGVHPSSIGVKAYKSRWGSCTSTGDVNFNWKIIMAPHSIVDYVVVHELCHLKYHDHSKAYWKLVSKIMPDYRERKEWLRVNGFRLEI